MPGFHLIAPAQVTGSVTIENVVRVTGTVDVGGISLSASLASQVDQGNSGSVPWKITGSVSLTEGVPIAFPAGFNVNVTASVPLTASVTGTVKLAEAIQVSNFPSGFNVNLTASVPLTASVTGTVGLSGPITGNVGVTNFPAVQAITGSIVVANRVDVTGSVGLSGPITGNVGVTNFPAVQAVTGSVGLTGPVTGNVGVTNFPATQNVSGSAWTPTITGSVKITEIVLVTGSLGLSAPVTGAFRLTEAATVLQHAVTISGSVPLIVTGSVTGSVRLSEAATVLQHAVTISGSVPLIVTGSTTLQSGSVTGLLVGGQPVAMSNPVPVTGTIGVVGTVSISGSSAVSGSVTVTGPGLASSRAGFVFGKLDTSVAGVQVIEHTTFTELTGNFKLSLVSASGTDTVAAGGTGARTVQITWFDVTGSGPFTEIIQMSGTTTVPISASSTCYIEKLEVLTVGTYGTNKGTISLKLGATGAGATVWTVRGDHGRTYGAHHYIPSGTICFITGMYGSKFNNTSQGSGGTFYLTFKDLVKSGAAERQATDYLNAYGQSSAPVRTYGTPVRVTGLARLSMYVFPDSALTTTYIGSFDFYEQDSEDVA